MEFVGSGLYPYINHNPPPSNPSLLERGGVLAQCHGNDCGHSADAIPVRAKLLKGTPSLPSLRQFRRDGDSPRPNIPTERPLGPIRPSSPAINLTMSAPKRITEHGMKNTCGGPGVSLGTSTVFGIHGLNPSDPSGAQAGQVIFATANDFAAFSTNGGATFIDIDPTVYSGPGFCCDQVVHYIPSIDRFVWLMQYKPNVNKLRLIIFAPANVDKLNGIKLWCTLDIFSTDLGLTGPLEGGSDLAVGNTYLYISATNTGRGLVVIRVPLAELKSCGPMITYWHTSPISAYGSRLSQNPTNAVFWAGHSVLGTTIQVFKWPDSATGYTWSSIHINSWPAGPAGFVSPCPGAPSTNWVKGAQSHDIIGATCRTANEVWFAWPASKGGGFPNVHIQIAQINVSLWQTLSLIKQWQIWNANFAFAYPSLYTNGCGDVGVAVAFGGGPYNPSSAVGIADSSGLLTWTVFPPELSNVCQDRFGDYLTVRGGNGRANFAGFIYAGQHTAAGPQWHPRFIEFWR